MGFRDTEWAYNAGRPLAEAAVLAALCHRTDDDTHETFVGQQTIAEMIGSSPEKVLRALKALEAAGVITRTRRHGAGGYRTSDLIRVNVDTYMTNRLVGETPTRQIAYQENRRDLPDDSSEPTWQKVTAEEINQKDQPEDHSEISPSSSARDLESDFERAYAAWPKKVERKKSLRAFLRAVKKRDVEVLIADIIRFGHAYARTTEKQYTPALCVWLNGERWDDEPPAPKLPTDDEWQTFLTESAAAQTLAGGRRVTRGEENLAFLARVEAKERAKGGCELAGHRWLPDGTCNFCTARQDQLEIGAA